MVDLAGQAVVVTGAGRGLGRLYALDLARRGASVVVNDLGTTMDGRGTDPSVADAVVAEIEGAGGRAVASHDSVAEPGSAQSIVDAAIGSFGRVDAVISNAGIFQTAPFEDIEVEDWRRMIQVHLDGAFHLSQAAYREMKSRGDGGRFVFISSSAGMFGQPNSAHYGAAKAGITGLASAIAVDGAEHGILANTVLPTGSSRMVTETVGSDAEAIAPFVEAIRPELVVPLVTYLASRSCGFTHQVISAIAGRYARVFVGLGEGWLAEPGSDPTAEDIADHLDRIMATEPFSVPTSNYDEVAEILNRLDITL